MAYLFEKYEISVLENNYDVDIKQKLQINSGYTEVFKKEVFDKSNGAIEL